MSPQTAILLGRLGGLRVLNLEGLWTRYDDPQPLFDEDAAYQRPDQGDPRDAGDLRSADRGRADRGPDGEIREAGVPVAGALSPQHTQAYAPAVVDSGADFFVIRGTTVSAEHVSREVSRSTSSSSSTTSTCR